MRPKYAIPGGIVGVMLLLAFLVQPPASSGVPADDDSLDIVTTPVATLTPTPTMDVAEPTSTTEAPTVAPGESPDTGGADPAGSETAEVAGAKTTPTIEPSAAPAVSETECGEQQGGTYAVPVSQTLSNVSVQATSASVYPIEYLRCLLLATGGRDAIALASALGEAGREGATHVGLVDVWIANSSRDFAQLALASATFSAAGQTFPALGTLAGGAEAVVASGQGRSVTIVGTITNTVGASTGPITLSIEGPRLGGEQVPGKYQLFLPTP